MKLGLFLMPSHSPERSLLAGQQWDLAVLREADRLGYSEAWIGENFTSRWEPNPAPDLLIAQALLQTRQIKLAPGAHLLPYHHPAELACRVAYMDHLAEGRYDPDPWFKSMRLLAEEVLPHFRGFDPDHLQHAQSANP
jgi:alkanesulfonate monooxygenase SsuD/methylene tetrahydromethanopterin reductase-like flavin-dependent oxidoreductase (luciferase family)